MWQKKTGQRERSLIDLPLEIMLMIFALLGFCEKTMLALTCKTLMETLRSVLFANSFARDRARFEEVMISSRAAQQLNTTFQYGRWGFLQLAVVHTKSWDEISRFLRNLRGWVPKKYELCSFCLVYRLCTKESQERLPWLIKKPKKAKIPTQMCYHCYAIERHPLSSDICYPCCSSTVRHPTVSEFFAKVSGTFGGQWVESGIEKRRREEQYRLEQIRREEFRREERRLAQLEREECHRTGCQLELYCQEERWRPG